jgi:hypothetical protein
MQAKILEFGLAFCWPLLVEFITERAFVGSFCLILSQKQEEIEEIHPHTIRSS